MFQCECGRYLMSRYCLQKHYETVIHQKWVESKKAPVEGGDPDGMVKCECGYTVKLRSLERHMNSKIHMRVMRSGEEDHTGIIYEISNERGDSYIGCTFLSNADDILDENRKLYSQYKRCLRVWQNSYDIIEGAQNLNIKILADKCGCDNRRDLNIIRKTFLENY